MNKKNIIIIVISITFIIALCTGIYLYKTNKKENTLIDDVQKIYSNALVKYSESKVDSYSNLSESDIRIDNVNENLSYMVKFNEKGQIVYLVVSNGVERFQLGSLYDNKEIKLEDITPEKIVKDETIVVEEKKNKIEYEIIDSGSNSSYVSN
jgi:5'-3' exonuclease